MIITCLNSLASMSIELSPMVGQIMLVAERIAHARNKPAIVVQCLLEATKLIDPALLEVAYPQLDVVYIRNECIYEYEAYEHYSLCMTVDLTVYGIIESAYTTAVSEGWPYVAARHLLDSVAAFCAGEM